LIAGVRLRRQGDKVDEDDENFLKHKINRLLENSPDKPGVVEDEEEGRKIPEEELHLIEDFLDKFVFVTSDASMSKEQIDLSLVLKALPSKIEESNIYRIDLINFSLI
jgi:hypothetical protein